MELDWEGLNVAFAARSLQMNHFLDLETGEVHAHLNGSLELRSALEKERAGRYLRIPKSTPDVDRARCLEFLPRMESEDARRLAAKALEELSGAASVNAFRMALVGFGNDEAAWFVFRDRCVREELRTWLRAAGVEV